jgi:hypothetical protein
LRVGMTTVTRGYVRSAFSATLTTVLIAQSVFVSTFRRRPHQDAIGFYPLAARVAQERGQPVKPALTTFPPRQHLVPGRYFEGEGYEGHFDQKDSHRDGFCSRSASKSPCRAWRRGPRQ